MTALVRVVRLGRPLTGRLALAVLAGAGAAGAAIGLTATSAWLISRAAERPPVLALLIAVTAVRAFGIARGVLRYAERLAAHDAAFRVLGRLRVAIFARLARLAPGGTSDLRTGDLLARLVDDTDGLADLWLRVLLPYASAAVIGLATAALLGWLVPLAGLVLLASIVVVAVGAPLAATLVAVRAERRIAPARGELADATLDLLGGAGELLASGATGRWLDHLAAIDARAAAAERTTAAGVGVGTLVAGLASGAALWLCLVLAIEAADEGVLAAVAIAVVAITPITVHEVVAPLVPAARHLPGLAVAARRVLEVTDRAEPVLDPVMPATLPAGPLGLRVRGLRLRYPGTARDAVSGLDLDVPARSHVVITGPSGSGKSTLAVALLRFLEPAAGSIELVGHETAVQLRDLTGQAARRAIGLCEQDPHIFDATVEANIRLAHPGADPGALRAALADAQLLDWVDSLPDGMATFVGEQGARISGGQRQRVALARALLADVPVLVLDEPTEHLDDRTARDFIGDLGRTTGGRTVIVLTHRPELFASPAWARAADLAAPGHEAGSDASGPR